MSGNNFITERLIGEFAENYTEKLFYFCLKKTGNSYEAEDLASDIILNILSALDKGTIPTSFLHGYGESRAIAIAYGLIKSINIPSL